MGEMKNFRFFDYRIESGSTETPAGGTFPITGPTSPYGAAERGARL